MFDVAKVRKDFPILEEQVYGKRLVYLDNGATTQRPLQVIEKMNEYYLKYNSNVHRGVHFLSNKCTDANEEAREIVRKFIHAGSDKEIIFTRGTTESINLVAFSFGEAFIREGDEILVTEMEHHANIVPWQMLCERKGAVLKVLPFNDKGELDLSQLDTLLTPRVKLVGKEAEFLQFSCLQDDCMTRGRGMLNGGYRYLGGTVETYGNITLSDSMEAIRKVVFEEKRCTLQELVEALDCDFFVFSGHKLYGPTGVGVLYGKEDLLNRMPPWQGGGEMIKEVHFEKTTYNELPFKFEAGTPDFIGVIGLGEAIRYVESLGLPEIAVYEQQLLDYAMERMRQVPAMRIFGEAIRKSSVLSFALGEIHHSDTGILLDKMGIAVRTGQLCAEPVMQHYGVTGMVRASIGMYNTSEEIDLFCEGLHRVAKMFKLA